MGVEKKTSDDQWALAKLYNEKTSNDRELDDKRERLAVAETQLVQKNNLLKDYTQKLAALTEKYEKIKEDKREIDQELVLKDRLLVLGKQTMADKWVRIETVLRASVQRLKQELIFVKKSALQEVEMMKS